MMLSSSMSWLLVVQPDSAQADTLREALGAHIRDARVVVAESLDDALLAIDQDIPDILLLPTLIPAAEEDYLISYLGTLPGARHVQILGLPRLQRPDDSVRPQARSLFAWRRRKGSDIGGTPGCDPDVFSQDVLAYLAGARALKQEIEFYSAHGASSGPERRREPRYATHEVPWISFARFGGEQAVLMNVSAGGALLRTYTRPGHDFVRRSDSNDRERSRLTLRLGPDRDVDAVGRVVRCVPLLTTAWTQYEIAFAFDDSIGLHLPAADVALVSASSGTENARLLLPA